MRDDCLLVAISSGASNFSRVSTTPRILASLARLGATVTGVDFSERAIEEAWRLAVEVGLETEATFVRSDLYELPENLDPEEGFDVVYTSHGVLEWLPDIERWAAVAARFVRPGGFLYVTEIHPVVQAFESACGR